MAERADSARELAEKLVLAGVGAVALTAERADALAEELSARGGTGARGGALARRGACRALAERDAFGWASAPGRGLAGVFRELGLVTRERVRGAGAARRPARAPAPARRAGPGTDESACDARLAHRARRTEALGRTRQSASGRSRGCWRSTPILCARTRRGRYGLERVPRRRRCGGRRQSLLGIDHPLIGSFCPRPVYVPGQGRAARDRRSVGRASPAGSACSRSGAARPTAMRCARRARARRATASSSASTSRARGSASGTRGRCITGGLMIAMQEGAPVIPCALDTFGWAPFNRRPCAVVWGEPMDRQPRAAEPGRATPRQRRSCRRSSSGSGASPPRPQRPACRRSCRTAPSAATARPPAAELTTAQPPQPSRVAH